MSHSELFIKSALSTQEALLSEDEILKWIEEQNRSVNVKIDRIRFDELGEWSYREDRLMHKTGKFFTIDGIRVKTNYGYVPQWDQPIINQPEVGFLGFITKEINGVLHFLIQAKIEPGNVNLVQLSPTLQATRSNYTQVHQGNKPLYLEYFQKATPAETLLDQLQSEQGARFLKKRNRNIIIKIDHDIPLYNNFQWVTLGQIKHLMRHSNVVNMDTRTVISGINFGSHDQQTIDLISFLVSGQRKSTILQAFLKSALSKHGALHTIEEIITFITRHKSTIDLDVSRIPLKDVQQWFFSDDEIYHQERKFFRVIFVNVQIGNREVVSWRQPMIEPAQEGLIAFVCKEINGIIHFAVQAKMECGNLDIIELAPTVQCLTGNYRQTQAGSLPFLEYVLQAPKENIIFDTKQSEEGGRFYHEQNRNLIVMAGDEVPIELPDRYIWMTLNQLYTFLQFNNYLNIQARSLISAISFTEPLS